LRNNRQAAAAPYHHASVEIGTEVPTSADSEHAVNTYIAASDVIAQTTQGIHATTETQTIIETQRQEWADFLAQVASEAAEYQIKRKLKGKTKKSKSNKEQWSRIKEKPSKNIESNEATLISQPKISRRYMNNKPPTNWSAISTINTVPPPTYPRSSNEINIIEQLPRNIFTIQTPVDVDRLEFITKAHPNRPFIRYILDGFRKGFRYCFQGQYEPVIQMNLPSIKLNPDAFKASVIDEKLKGRYIGPFKLSDPPVYPIRVNPCGLVPKRDTNPTVYRVINHQSAPYGNSINDGIEKEDFNTTYEHVGHAAQWIRYFGKDCLLTKIDIKEAYRIIPIDLLDQTLQGIICEKELYFDKCAAFGNRASGGIFCRVADLIAWIAVDHGIPAIIHYVDDFLLITPREGKRIRELFEAILQFLRVPFKKEKTVGPATKLQFLGITLDTITATASIPEKKREELITHLKPWQTAKSCSITDLQSLIGYLIWVCQVIPHGRPFVQSFIDRLKRAHGKNTRVYLGATNREDARWWITTLLQWNGIYLFEEIEWTYPTAANFYTDASDWGGGACFGHFYTWFPWRKDIVLTEMTIQVREMFMIIVAILTFQRFWERKKLVIDTDSQANIASVARGACNNPLVNQLIKLFVSVQVLGSFSLRLRYINTHDNKWADALSRGDPGRFKEDVKDATFISPIFPTDFPIIV
jgi:hypothetical protein